MTKKCLFLPVFLTFLCAIGTSNEQCWQGPKDTSGKPSYAEIARRAMNQESTQLPYTPSPAVSQAPKTTRLNQFTHKFSRDPYRHFFLNMTELSNQRFIEYIEEYSHDPKFMGQLSRNSRAMKRLKTLNYEIIKGALWYVTTCSKKPEKLRVVGPNSGRSSPSSIGDSADQQSHESEYDSADQWNYHEGDE
jgi:hypothetical protein